MEAVYASPWLEEMPGYGGPNGSARGQRDPATPAPMEILICPDSFKFVMTAGLEEGVRLPHVMGIGYGGYGEN